MSSAFAPFLPWYKKPWGITLLFALAFFIFLGSAFVYTTLSYLKKIKKGEAITLEGPWTQNFTKGSGTQNLNGVQDWEQLRKSAYPILGVKDAPITIVQFSDYKCPNSKAAYPIMRQLAGKYGDKVNLVIRDFPVESGSTRFSAVARCANEQKRFWKAHDFLFQNQDLLVEPLPEELITGVVNYAGLSEKDFRECLSRPQITDLINEDFVIGVGSGVRGTPTFFVNGIKVEGAIPFDVWERYINAVTP